MAGTSGTEGCEVAPLYTSFSLFEIGLYLKT